MFNRTLAALLLVTVLVTAYAQEEVWGGVLFVDSEEVGVFALAIEPVGDDAVAGVARIIIGEAEVSMFVTGTIDPTIVSLEMAGVTGGTLNMDGVQIDGVYVGTWELPEFDRSGTFGLVREENMNLLRQ